MTSFVPVPVAMIVFLAFSAVLSSDTIHVPGDYPTIQQAIDAAANYDTVLVSPGTYVENLVLQNKHVDLRSTYGPTATVIDGNQQGSVVVFYSSSSLIEGFTVTNGSGTWIGSPEIDHIGGGIFCYYSGSIIRNNIITDNRVDQYPQGSGGGIGCRELNAPVIEHNIIEHNHAFHGGGIYYGESYPQSEITIRNNMIRGNITYTTSPGPGIGGGICVEGATPFILNNEIIENDGTSGGGIYCYDVHDGIISGNLISFNMDSGIKLSLSSIPITSNIICNNENPWDRGGGIYCFYSDSPILNNTIACNKCKYSGGGIYCREASPTMTNTLLWNNSATTKGHQIGLEYTSTITVDHCDVMGDAGGVWVEAGSTLNWGAGNQDRDPLFVESAACDYHIPFTSPCRDAGDSSVVDPGALDFEGDPRIAWGGTVDMGADEFFNHLYVKGNEIPGGDIVGRITGLPSTAPVGLFVGSGTLPSSIPTLWGDFWLQAPWILFTLYPIPANGLLEIPTTLPKSIPAPYDVPMQALIGLNEDSLTNLYVLEVR